MNYFTTKQIFYINSNNRVNQSDTHSSFSYQLNIDPNQNFDKVVVLSAAIPKSYYLIQSVGNTFTLTEGTSTATIIIPPGNYSRNGLALVLKSVLNASSPNGYVYTITFSNISSTVDTGKYLFGVSGNGSTQPSFTFGITIAEQLGFEENNTYNFSSNSLTSVYVCNLVNENTLFIHSNICQNTEGNSILQEIYASGEPSYTYIKFTNYTPQEYSKPMTDSRSNLFTFNLTNEDGILIDTNGININFTLMVYKRNNIFDLLKEAIKYFTM